MIPLNRIHSTIDQTVKHLFDDAKGQVVEAVYLNKNDGKDIVVVPSQTSCKMGCTFCFLTGSQAPARNLTADEIVSATHAVLETLPTRNQTLLISYMGSGEPLVNLPNVIESAVTIRNCYRRLYPTVRFALASIIPTVALVDKLTKMIEVGAQYGLHLPFKVHFSLHSPFDAKRQALMPSAAPIAESLDALGRYRERTGQPVEIHYTLIEGENDRNEDLTALLELLVERKMPVKFLAFRPRPDAPLAGSSRLAFFRHQLEACEIPTEFYDPPGNDIGASCGQFLLDAEKRGLQLR